MLSSLMAFVWLAILLFRISTNNFEISPFALSGIYVLLIMHNIFDGLDET